MDSTFVDIGEEYMQAEYLDEHLEDVLSANIHSSCSIALEQITASEANSKPDKHNRPVKYKRRKYNVLTIKDKNIDLNLLNCGKTVLQVADETGLPRSTVYGIKKQEIALRHCKTMANKTIQFRKRIRLPTHVLLNEAVLLWFYGKRQKHIPISDALLCEKCKLLHETSCTTPDCRFRASYGWLRSFKARNGIRTLTVSGEKLDADIAAVEPFKNKLTEIITSNNYSADDIYNADETALVVKALPSKSLVSFSEKTAPGRKSLKERLTITPCSNASGSHKLPLQVLGRAANPRCFKTQGVPDGIHYFSNKKAWQTSATFTDWFYSVFVPEIKRKAAAQNRPAKALLILDNCTAHCSKDKFQVDDAEIQVIFLPPNVTSILQPMDQGIINAFKVIYKSNFLRRVLLETDSDCPVTEVIKSFSLYDAIQLATHAWATITPETIANCWRNLLSVSQDQNYNSFNDFTISSPTSDPRVLLSKVVQLVDPNYVLTEEEVQEWLSNSDNIDVAQIYTDEQLTQYIASGGDFFEADHEEQDCDANESAEGYQHHGCT
ncbi:jerky protein homolog-like [Toxorhynchites rutilus septentrionalis]|uniref:jerky protein homolog-like n=1 Tax=Toxorhynchites rutilus septentrionalis TaxID=329112 RepID=UPI002478349C|nr:jerky protein homolog-like [Toxorhynchites rutilus septentrionalis]